MFAKTRELIGFKKRESNVRGIITVRVGTTNVAPTNKFRKDINRLAKKVYS